ncbi:MULTISPECIES: hypothetical protein [unclassified Xanthobacter]|uniref:hypothetical protein n=1 Tax=unclassified Xanthobacter TaxID=2623496 RepID=UPI001F40F4B9|nr:MULTISPECIES: hypothetical protein [unclassified Xanthobacter]
MTGDGDRRGNAGGPRAGVLVALFGAALLLFNFPLLAIWNVPATVLGLPLLPVALFAIWAGLVALIALASEGRHPGNGGGAP